MGLRAFPILLACVCASAWAQEPRFALDDAGACERLYAETDAAVLHAEVRDGAAARIDGFPYLRLNRPLESYAAQPLNDTQFDDWVRRLRALDQLARGFELANLPADRQTALRDRHAALVQHHGSLEAALQDCGALLAERGLSLPQARQTLVARARVPDDYDQWKRIVGLYWFTRIPFAYGVRGYQRGVQATFDQPVEKLAVHGRLRTYASATGETISTQESGSILERASRNPLGIPEPAGADLERLFELHAPIWVVDERDDNDRIGRLTLGADGQLRVDTSAAVVYRRLAHTRYGELTLLQLVYSVWFPARPKTSTSDLLGGEFDGVAWRVTLAPDGSPLVYDSIHNCGCYHQFFPTPRAALRPQPDTLDETAFVPQRLEAIVASQRIVLRIETRTHYLQRILVGDAANEPSTPYVAIDDDTLRSLSQPSGARRSAFREDGIVQGSERAERYLLWPMGVREPGAMRQWGRHATAFVGRRHFDEARLMERYFHLRLQ